jgi:endonuclease-3
MKKQERLAVICKTLDHYFPSVMVPLTHDDPYTLLIAVLLSAQCTDERVNSVTPLLFQRAKTPEQMVKLSVDEIYAIIKPCGLGMIKAKGIHQLSQKLIDNHDGKVPASFEALESLPQVGHKTASVVMSAAFNIPAFPVDTHIHRLAKRWKLSQAKSVEMTERDLKKHFLESEWSKRHLQIIFFARKFCPARGHDWNHCPICSALDSK